VDQDQDERREPGQRVLRNEPRSQRQWYHGHTENGGGVDHRDIAVHGEGQRDLHHHRKHHGQRGQSDDDLNSEERRDDDDSHKCSDVHHTWGSMGSHESEHEWQGSNKGSQRMQRGRDILKHQMGGDELASVERAGEQCDDGHEIDVHGGDTDQHVPHSPLIVSSWRDCLGRESSPHDQHRGQHPWCRSVTVSIIHFRAMMCTYLGAKGRVFQHDRRVAELLDQTILALNGYEGD
jgi:transcription initiation factor IIF auxiliary subunit